MNTKKALSEQLQLMKTIFFSLGEVSYSYAQKFNYETLVIGGNIANAWELFFPETKNILDKLPAVTIKKAELGEDML